MAERLVYSGRKSELSHAKLKWEFVPRPGGWWLATARREDGSLIRKRIRVASKGNSLGFHLGTAFGQAEVKPKRSSSAGGSDAEDDLTAQFPGKVRKVLVQEGDQVKAGDSLLLVEAMKMEFAIQAPVDGTVAKLLVSEGQQLAPGDRYLEIQGDG